MADIESATVEIGRGKKRRKNKLQHENIYRATIKQPIECRTLTTATTHRHNDKRRNRFLKHKKVK